MSFKEIVASIANSLAKSGHHFALRYHHNGLEFIIHDPDGNIVKRKTLDTLLMTKMPNESVEQFVMDFLGETIATGPYEGWDSESVDGFPNLANTNVAPKAAVPDPIEA